MIKLQTPHVPESLGYDSSRLDILDRFFQRQVDKKAIIGGCWAIARDGKLLAGGAVGKQSYRTEDERPLRPDAIFRLASVTKLFTAVAVFQLIEQGLCRLDDTMMTWLPELGKDFTAVTIAHALSHTGGLPPDDGVYPLNGKPGVWELIDRELASGGCDWITAGLSFGRSSEPGTRWEYSSFGWALLGELIGRITGARAERYIEQNILAPCGMTDSGFADTMAKRPELAERIFFGGEYAEQRLREAAGGLGPIPQTGGGLYATVTDMVKFGNMLLGGGRIDGRRVLGRKTVERMTSTYTKPNIQDFSWGRTGEYKRYGLGPDLNLGDIYLGSDGAYYHEGHGRSLFAVDPAERFVSVFFAPQPDPDVWDPVVAYNAHNIIMSGLI